MHKSPQAFDTTTFKCTLLKRLVFYLETERFLSTIRDKSPKVIEIEGFGHSLSLSNFVRFCSDVESQKRCQHFTNAFWGMVTLAID